MHSINFTSMTEVPEHVDLAIIAMQGVIPGFFGIIKELSHEDLTRFCNIDYDRERAIIAEVRHGEKREEIVVGRLIMEPGRKHGEFTVVVTDEYQGHGLGIKLIDVLNERAK